MAELGLEGRRLADTVIVASMIQWEAGHPDEMPLKVGIIWKKLDENLPPTVVSNPGFEAL